jgi:DNA gyrase subunit B
VARFEHGETVIPLKVCGESLGKKGTEVRFLASTDTFSNREFQFKTLENRLRELAFLNSGVKIKIQDKRSSELIVSELCYDGGVSEFVKYLDRSRIPLISEPIFISGERDEISLEIAMWWNDG